jgi:S1-C subfamily serine protease
MGMTGIDAPGGGALVTQVFPYTAATHAGLREGDTVIEFNGQTVSTLAALFQSARNAGEGMPIILRIRRAGVDLFLGLQLGRHPQFN